MPSKRLRQFWIFMVLVSLTIVMCVVAFDPGIAATSYGTTDSMGRKMGFNDVFSNEHYQIILSNCSVSGTLQRMSTYDWILVGFHFLTIGLLLFESNLKWTLRVCILQPLIFPTGFLGFLFGPLYVSGVIRNSNDREIFIDVPFVWIMAPWFWICVAMAVAWKIFRSRSAVKRMAARKDLEQSLAW